MTRPDIVLDLETTGLIGGFRQHRTDVGISEWATLPAGRYVKSGYTNILAENLRKSSSAEDYWRRATSGPVAWQPGFARPGDVLAGVHERHVAAAVKASTAGTRLASEQQIVKNIEAALESGTVGGWNIGFDMSILRQAAERTGSKSFLKTMNRAHAEGRIVEMAEPAQRFLFGLASSGKWSLGHVRREARGKIAFGEYTPGQIRTLPIEKLYQEHAGFKELFKRFPGISYEEYKTKIGGSWPIFETQEFGYGQLRPEMRYVRGWRQHVLAEAISPGFMRNPTSTMLGQAVAKRVGEQAVTAHSAKYDVGLSSLLHEIFSSKDPWAALRGYGVRSQEQFMTQYRSAFERDLRDQLATYLPERARQAPDLAYLRKVLGGAEELERKASEIARVSAKQGKHFAGIPQTFRGALLDVQQAAKKHPKIALGAALVGSLLLADAFVPEDNRLEGIRQQESNYTQIDGITFGGIGAPATYSLTDFGSGRSQDNASSQIRAWRTSRYFKNRAFRQFSAGDVALAQQKWGSAVSQRGKRYLDRADYVVRKAGEYSVPGVRPDAYVGSLDLRAYHVKADDADTVNLYRRGIFHMFDKPISVRLAGIDAPETHPSWPFGMQPSGIESGEYLQTLIDHQNSMRLLIDPSRTTYGRHVGVLMGDIDPNINLKLVRAGAAAQLPGDNRSIVNFKTYQRAENMAAAAGLGMWSSKGWQAKRMMDDVVGDRVTNTSLMQMERIVQTAGMAEYSDLVQSLHRAKPDKDWTNADIDAMTQVMASRKKERMWDVNAQIKNFGWARGIRDGDSAWNTVDPGISPSDLTGANVSAFGSGWSVEGAEKVLRMTAPLRRRFIPQMEPIMRASGRKLTGMDYARHTRERMLAAEVLRHRISASGPAPFVQGRLAIDPHLLGATQASAAGTARTLTGPTLTEGPRQKFLGALYSTGLAYKSPYRGANEYQSLKGWGFGSGWQETAWKSFRAGTLSPKYALAGYWDMYQSLRGLGLSRVDATAILKRYKAVDALGKYGPARNRVMTARERAKETIGALYYGRPLEVKGRARNFIAKRLTAITGKTDALQLARSSPADFYKSIGQTLRTKAAQELNLRRAIWRRTVSSEKTMLGKLGGMLDFVSDIGSPLRAFTPKQWQVGLETMKRTGAKIETGVQAWARRKVVSSYEHLFGKAKKSVYVPKARAWARGQMGKVPGLLRLGRGARKLLSKAGPLELALGIPFVLSESQEYRNRTMGIGVESSALLAEISIGYAVGGALTAAGAYAGSVAGAAVGAALGVGVGAGVGATVGYGVGWVMGAAATLALTLISGEAIRGAGQLVAPKRNADPYGQTQGDVFGPQIPGLSMFGGTDQYLTAGHGISFKPEASGFGGGLKPAREARILAETLSKTAPKVAGAGIRESVPVIRRRPSQFTPTSGLVTKVLWGNRHRISRGGTKWPVQWCKRHKPRVHPNESRMIRAA